MGLFYHCIVEGCNRKYKTALRLKEHLLKEHERDIPEDQLPEAKENVKPTKEEKKQARDEKKKQERIAIEEEERKKKEAMIQERQKKEKEERELKEIAEKQEREANIEKYRTLERKKLEMLEKIAEEKEDKLCQICMDAEREAAPMPCGHKLFCFKCISSFREKNPRKGCPYCNKEIIMVCKIYE